MGGAEGHRQPSALLMQPHPCILPPPFWPQSELVHTDVIKLKAEGTATDGPAGLQLHTVGRNPSPFTSTPDHFTRAP